MNKKLLMIPEGRLKPEQKEAVVRLSKKYPNTGRAFRMVQSLDAMYACTSVEAAAKAFKQLISWLKRSRLEPMKKAATTLVRLKAEILEYFQHRLTNALAEGLNSLIQSAKRRARGYGTLRSYMNMIYLVVGKLKLDCVKVF